MQSLLLIVLTLTNSTAGLLLQVIIAKLYGVGVKTDAYFQALAAPLFLVGLYSAQSTFRAVPALMSRAEEGSNVWSSAAKSYFETSVLVGVGMAILGTLLWPPSSASALAAHRADFAVALRVLCWTYGAAQIPLAALVALLQSRQRYATALIIAGAPQMLACVSIIALRELDIWAVPTALTLATVASVATVKITLLPPNAANVEHRPVPAPFGRRILVESPYTVATLACFSVYAVIDSFLLPQFRPGFLTTANVCQRLVIGIGQLVIASPLTLITKDLVQQVHSRDPAGFQKCMWATVRKVVVHSTLVAIALYVSADWIMFTLLSSRAGAGFDVSVASRTLRQMLPGMILMLSSNIVVRSALTIPRLVRWSWWLGVAWGVAYAIAIEVTSSPQRNGSGYSYSISWAIAFVSFSWFLRRTGPAFILAGASR